jgi:hypothetical protein
MSNSIFNIKSYNRNEVHWENHLYDLTPVEKHNGVWFKRDDYFAPLGYGSVNGSKLRQCIYLVNRWVKENRISGVVSGSVVGSPQHPFIASICKHYGIGCLIATGSKHYLEHKNMALAHSLGAKFYVAKVGYAKALQSISFQLAKKLTNHCVLETNITVDEKLNNPADIERFHEVGAYQVNNISDEIETLIIPCGSCNSVVSILYGLAIKQPKSLKNIILMGIGNNGSKNLGYIPKRLAIISDVLGIKINSKFDFTDIGFGSGSGLASMKIHHFNLNGSGYCRYEDLMPYTISSIEFHPRYEGKCINYIMANMTKFAPYWNEKTLFWIVGNEPKWV